MIDESYYQREDECHHLLHSSLFSNRPTILILHGLGDSALSYREFLFADVLKHCNVLIPDFLGYGKSSGGKNYSFSYQVDAIKEHIHFLEKKINITLDNFYLVSHSMGGIHATLLCESALKSRIKGFINVEGSVTQYGSFVTASAAKAIEENNFPSWFEDFKQNKIYPEYPRYYVSLMSCHADAFQQNALELFSMFYSLSEKFSHLFGKKYAELAIPRIYCYGKSMCPETIAFLNEKELIAKPCHFAKHFFMPDGFEEILNLLTKIIKEDQVLL